MSASRIFDEICFQLEKDPDIKHVEFLDLLFNGDMRVLEGFCDLMIKNKIHVRWHANAVVRKEMTSHIFRKMKKAGCFQLTFGIESGSQRIIDQIQKKFHVEDAGEVIRNCHNSGIAAVCNFMFGFPQETENDFLLTIDFLRSNAEYIDIVYPSRSFFCLEHGSTVERDPERFGIDPGSIHPHYWESMGGANNYLKRRQRCEEFSKIAADLGVYVGLGLGTSVELDKWYNLGCYYMFKGDTAEALRCFDKYLSIDPDNGNVTMKRNSCRESMCSQGGV